MSLGSGFYLGGVWGEQAFSNLIFKRSNTVFQGGVGQGPFWKFRRVGDHLLDCPGLFVRIFWNWGPRFRREIMGRLRGTGLFFLLLGGVG